MHVGVTRVLAEVAIRRVCHRLTDGTRRLSYHRVPKENKSGTESNKSAKNDVTSNTARAASSVQVSSAEGKKSRPGCLRLPCWFLSHPAAFFPGALPLCSLQETAV